MIFPEELSAALEEQLSRNIKLNEIDKKAKEISKRYRENDNNGTRLLTENNEAIAYALARMPATFGAVSKVFEKLEEQYCLENIESMIDIGAGTGAGTWAAFEHVGNLEVTCLERENAMLTIGKELMKNHEDLQEASWKKFDVIKDSIDKKADIVITSYLINELPKNEVKSVIEKMWNATNNLLIVIEPGTPKGFSNIKDIRNILIHNEGKIVAPCTHMNECELPENDWCNFTCRVPRSKVHKMLKDGSASYEDEKFSYIVFSKKEAKCPENRIIRHPIINKGYSEYKICSKTGIKVIKLSKKDGEIYKSAKKKGSGDFLILGEVTNEN